MNCARGSMFGLSTTDRYIVAGILGVAALFALWVLVSVAWDEWRGR